MSTELEVLQRIEERLARLEQRLDRATAVTDQVEPLLATVVDTVDSLAGRLVDRGVDLEARLVAAVTVSELLTRAPVIDALRDLMDSRMLAPATLRSLGRVGAAVAEASGTPPPSIGMVGLWRALRDPDVQRATGFLVSIAKALGAQLDDKARSTPSPAALPAAT